MSPTIICLMSVINIEQSPKNNDNKKVIDEEKMKNLGNKQTTKMLLDLSNWHQPTKREHALLN